MDKSTTINKIPFVLITGFLGSGKTSLLRHILTSLSSEKRIAIVQNDYAPGKTDSFELKNTGRAFDLLEVYNGSVFCVCMLDTFISQLAVFIEEYKPEIIFLEATGLADPVSIGQMMQAPEVQEHLYLSTIWTVVDCVNFNRAHQFIQRVRHQIQIADLILLNKSDLQKPDEQFITSIRQWNPFAEMIETNHGYVENITDKLQLSSKKPSISENLQENSAGRPQIASCVIRTQKIYTEQIIREFWKKNKNQIYRMKGYAKVKNGGFLLVQGVFDQLEITRAELWAGPTEIIFLGPGLEPKEFTREFLDLV
ncbi:MAG: GTP-binding protein [Bacteroidales bacterium]|nr:GTP-binding protein [Bacteroidales bacterium]